MIWTLGALKATIYSTVHVDFCFSLYCLKHGPFMTYSTKQTRLENSIRLLYLLKHSGEARTLNFFPKRRPFEQDCKTYRIMRSSGAETW